MKNEWRFKMSEKNLKESEERVRKSGLKLLGDVVWGTHFCVFYDTKEDMLDILIPYFKAGLENNEYCMWITSEPLNKKTAEEAMRKAVPDFDQYLKKQQIEILPYTEWYIKDNVFDLQRVLNGWVEKLNNALTRGYEGLRTTGNTAWLEKKDWKSFTDYEEEINTIITDYKMLAICTYQLKRCGSSEIIDVIRNHQFAIIRRDGKWEIFKSMEQLRVEHELKESEEKYRSFVQNLQGIAFRGKPNFKPIFFHGAVEEITGYTEKEFITGNPTWGQIIHPDDISKVREVSLKLESSPNSSTWAEHRIIRKDGQIRWVLERTQNISDESGNLLYVQGAIYDITKRKKAEKTLRDNKNILEKTLYSLRDAVFILDAKNPPEIIECNPITTKIFGYTKEEMLGRTTAFLHVNAEFLKKFQQQLYLAIEKDGHCEISEFKMKRKDGSTFTSSHSVYPLENDIGKRIGWVSVVRDITERKEAEEKLKESEKKYRYLSVELETILDLIPGLVYCKDKNDVITRVNQTFADSLKLNKEDMIGKTTFDFFPSEQAKKYRNDDLEVITSGKQKLNIEESGDFPDGKMFTITSKVPQYNDKGEIVGTIGLTIDITKQKIAEQKLKESEEKFRRIFQAIPDLFFLISKEGTYLDFKGNPNLMYVQPEFFINKNILEILPEKEGILLYNAIQNTLNTKTPMNLEYSLPIGEKVIHFEGRILYFSEDQAALFIRDITERKIAEQKLKESETKYREAYNLVNFYKDLFAHDMNNILQSIISSAEFYSIFRNEPEKLKDLGDISVVVQNHARRGASLVSNVRKLSKLDETEAQLNAIQVFNALNQSVEQAVSGFQERNVKIEINGLSEDMKILGNELLIDIFDNILNNALKYNANEEEVKVEVNVSKILENDKQYIEFKFSDYGMGVPDDKKKTLFKRSYTEDISKRGMGMGLSLVKKIVDKYGGKIWVEDRVKGDYTKGSIFIVMLKEAL